jgi:hypothetical protein
MQASMHGIARRHLVVEADMLLLEDNVQTQALQLQKATAACLN